MKISKELYTFFKEWLEWAEGGGKEHGVFRTHAGLCYNLWWWSCTLDVDCEKELCDILKEQLGNKHYPFGRKEYDYRSCNDTQHKCPMRLAFVREQIKKYEEE